MIYMYVCMCINMPGAHGGQQGASDHLGLELQAAVSHHVGVLNGMLVLCKDIKNFLLLIYLYREPYKEIPL